MCAEISYDRVFVYFPIFIVRFEELCAFLAPVLLVVRALEGCRGIERADFLRFLSFLEIFRNNPTRSERLIGYSLFLSVDSLPVLSLPKVKPTMR